MTEQKGITILELLVALAIIGVVAGMAVPAYNGFLASGYRSEAQRELVKIYNLQEQYFSDHKTYTTDMTALGLSADPFVSDSGNYSIDTASVTDITLDYKITATAKGFQLSNDGKCKTMTMDNLGNVAATDGSNDTTETCWP